MLKYLSIIVLDYVSEVIIYYVYNLSFFPTLPSGEPIYTFFLMGRKVSSDEDYSPALERVKKRKLANLRRKKENRKKENQQRKKENRKKENQQRKKEDIKK